LGAAFLRLLIGVLACAFSADACDAHVVASATVQANAGFDSVLVALLAAVSALYARGVARLWRKAGVGRGVRVAEAWCFALGIAVLLAALVSPLAALASRSFSMHMIEHEMLMVVAAPLLVRARPLEAWAWALSSDARDRVVRWTRTAAAAWFWRSTTAPVSATVVHALALWVWHAPVLFVAALASEPLHALQHVCFLASALAFWWAMFGGATRNPGPTSLACLFATMLHTSALGALLTLAPSAMYGSGEPRVFGLAPLQDQQLGGLVMWVPGGLAYVVAGLAIVAHWLASPRVSRNVR
jgi:cytochrome c oxidase assembly factor CtaG